jgi:hypothetical protein
MVRTWLLSVSVLCLSIQAGFAQVPPPNPFPSAVPLEPARPISTYSYSPLNDRNGSSLVGNVNLDGPRDNLGWFGAVDLDLLGSHVTNQLTAPVTVGGRTDQVSLPAATLHWTVAPRFELGYRLGQGAGEFLISTRFLETFGSTTTPAFDPAGNAGFLHSRLALSVTDLDYANQELSLQPWFDMKWRFGVRLADLYFSSSETSPLLYQRVSDHFFGAGPHAALELWHPVHDSRFGLFGKLDAAGLFGKVRQGFEETLPGPITGFTRQSQLMPSAMLNVQAGIGWTPRDNWRFSAGYSYEHWWDAAYVNASRGEVATQGVFFRGEWKY